MNRLAKEIGIIALSVATLPGCDRKDLADTNRVTSEEVKGVVENNPVTNTSTSLPQDNWEQAQLALAEVEAGRFNEVYRHNIEAIKSSWQGLKGNAVDAELIHQEIRTLWYDCKKAPMLANIPSSAIEHLWSATFQAQCLPTLNTGRVDLQARAAVAAFHLKSAASLLPLKEAIIAEKLAKTLSTIVEVKSGI